MKIAILGLAQTGKKTLFTLLTGRPVLPTRKPDEAVGGNNFTSATVAPFSETLFTSNCSLNNPSL